MFRRIITFSLLFLSLAFIKANSLTLAKASIEELTLESSIVVHGKVFSIRSEWDDESLKTIKTIVTLNVIEYLKGTEQQYLVFEQMGGQIGDIGDVISGTPVLKKGDEVILFLQNNQGILRIHSIALGCFRVVAGKDGTEKVVNDLSDTHLMNPITQKYISPDKSIFVYDLIQFINDVKGITNKN